MYNKKSVVVEDIIYVTKRDDTVFLCFESYIVGGLQFRYLSRYILDFKGTYTLLSSNPNFYCIKYKIHLFKNHGFTVMNIGLPVEVNFMIMHIDVKLCLG